MHGVPAKFKTKIGVGQHIRLRHPNVANERRIQAAKLDIERKKQARVTARENKTRTTTLTAEAAPIATVTGEVTAVRKRTKFTTAEDEIIRLNAQYAGSKKINVMIAESVPGKTCKQIGSRRKCLGLINSASNTLTPAPEPSTVGCDLQQRALQKPTESTLDRTAFEDACNIWGSEKLTGTSAEIPTKAIHGEYRESEMQQLLATLKESC